MNWGYFVLRTVIGLSLLTVLFLSQRFWYRAFWRITSNWRSMGLRVVARLAYIAALLLVIFAAIDGIRAKQNHIIPPDVMITAFAGLWFSGALFAFLAVKLVRLLDRSWAFLHRSLAKKLSPSKARSSTIDATAAKTMEVVPDPSRRYFFRTATMAAGAAPFLGVMYGFAAERLNYQVRRVEIPIANWPSALDGMKIVQLSDIHLSDYMPRAQVRRAVDMANELGADLAVVTGDFITGSGDPIADCIDEVRRLYAPLGTWGCNGNHEIYARAEDTAQQLFAQAGMKLLRQENAQITFRGEQFNLIGVDYQRERATNGHRLPFLSHVEHLVCQDMPNILLSHNPNSFNRAAELGIELTLSGHTHGGQIQVEILDHSLSPARFIANYIAGAYHRPLFAPSPNDRAKGAEIRHGAFSTGHGQEPEPTSRIARLYVNRGLGTVGAPVRLGVPPEITLLVLRQA